MTDPNLLSNGGLRDQILGNIVNQPKVNNLWLASTGIIDVDIER
jgi:hypothetical protein